MAAFGGASTRRRSYSVPSWSDGIQRTICTHRIMNAIPQVFAFPIRLDLHTWRNDQQWDKHPETFARLYQMRRAALAQTNRRLEPLVPYWILEGRHRDRRCITQS